MSFTDDDNDTGAWLGCALLLTALLIGITLGIATR